MENHGQVDEDGEQAHHRGMLSATIQIGMTAAAFVAALYAALAVRRLARAQQGTRQEVRRLRRHAERASDDARAGATLLADEVELLGRMILSHDRRERFEREQERRRADE